MWTRGLVRLSAASASLSQTSDRRPDELATPKCPSEARGEPQKELRMRDRNPHKRKCILANGDTVAGRRMTRSLPGPVAPRQPERKAAAELTRRTIQTP